MIKLYSTLTRQKHDFLPHVPKTVSMYVCGLTPYDSAHIGHATAAVRFNVLRTYLEFSGYKVTFVQNVTDVEDKIIKRAQELGEMPLELAARYSDEYQGLLRQLGIRPADHQPKVSEYIPQIIKYIEQIVARGFAYVTSDGDVYFDLSKKSDYGKLSGRKVDELLTDTRDTVQDGKRAPLDFVLWKRDDVVGSSWDSPWGRGRPGWHIECSVMANSILGAEIDLHGGGLDLIFPHHENEIAQCEAHNGCDFARYWCHSGLLNIEGTKMSKSLGNFITLREALDTYGAALLVYVILKVHYRSPIDFSAQLFRENLNGLADYWWFFEDVASVSPSAAPAAVEQMTTEFIAAMDNDFNTSVALTVLADGLKAGRALLDAGKAGEARCVADEIRRLGRSIGLFAEDYTLNRVLTEGLRFIATIQGVPPVTPEDVQRVLADRVSARERKDFAESDRLRDELLRAGVQAFDRKGKGVSDVQRWLFVGGTASVVRS